MTITAAQQQDLYKLAVGLYGAAPGMLHLNALADSLIAGASVAQVYDALANQASFQGQDPAYGDTASDAQFVSQFVERLVGDSALQADKDAVADYLAAMLPTSTRGALMHLAIDLLDAVDESDATWGEAAARLHNRIEAARYYTEDLAGDATELSTLQGTIAAVTSDDATVRAANHANTVAANPGVPGVDTGDPPQLELPDPASQPAAPGATDSADNLTGNIPPDTGGPAGNGASTDSTGNLSSQGVAAAVTGLITATVTSTDGNGAALPGGGTDSISSYSAQNEISGGSLRIEASQDAGDSMSFATSQETQYILGEVVQGSDQTTVIVGEAGAQDSIVLTGFEVLQGSPSDDLYSMADLNRVLNNLTLVDDNADADSSTPSADSDTIAVLNDAVGFQAAPTDTISLETLNDAFGFDFDVLDITGVTDNNLLLVGDDDDRDDDGLLNFAPDFDADYPGDAVQTRDLNDTVRVGSLDLIDDVSLFQTMIFTEASIASAGDEFVLDIDAGEFQDGGGNVLFTFDPLLTTFDFSAVDGATDLEITVSDALGVGVTVIIGGQDTITGGAGNDIIEGGAGADTMDGGIAAEVREFNLEGIADAVLGQTFAFDFMSQGNLTLTEAAVADTNYTDGAGAVMNGAGSDAFGTALASLLRGNLAQVNTDWSAGGGDVGSVIAGVGYSTTTNLLTFTFAAGLDVATAIDLGVTDGDAGTLGISAQTTTAQGGTGGSDTFVIGDTDSGITLATADRITGWDTTDFLALGVAGTGVNYSEAGAAVANFAAALTAANSALDTTVGYAFQFDATNGYLFEDTDLDGSANQVIVLAGIDNTEFAAGNIIA